MSVRGALEDRVCRASGRVSQRAKGRRLVPEGWERPDRHPGGRTSSRAMEPVPQEAQSIGARLSVCSPREPGGSA